MYEKLVQRLREEAIQWCANCIYKSEESPICHAPEEPSCDIRDRLQAADAIEKLTEVIQNHGFLESLIKPRWVSVTEALPESVDDDVLVTDGEGCAVGYWRPDAQAWDSTDFGWLENRSEPPCGIHTVTHWMPLPPLPAEPPKEEREDADS